LKLVFCATGHIGGPAATHLQACLGAEHVRVATSRADMTISLAHRFPGSDVIHANMRNQSAMTAALSEVDAVLVVTPDLFDDRAGAEVLIAAARDAGVSPHVVRINAIIPGVGVDDLPGILAGPIGRRGHLEACALIEQSGLHASFLAIVAHYMDDLLIHFASTLSQGRLLVPFDRPMAWADPADVGVAAAQLMIAAPPATPQLLPINNGENGILFSQLAARITQACAMPAAYIDDEPAFRREIGPLLSVMTGSDALTDCLIADWQLERSHAEEYFGRPLLSTLLSRSPTKLEDWLGANAKLLMN